MARKAKEIIKNNVFLKDYNKFKSKGYYEKEVLRFTDKTPLYLYNLGSEENIPIAINMQKLKKVMSELKDNPHMHGISEDILFQIPDALNNPLNVIKSEKFKNRYVIVTQLADKKGNIIIAPIEINSKGNVNEVEIDINKLNSIYGKEQYDGNDNPKVLSYMEQNKNNIVYDIDYDITKKESFT